MGILGKLFGGKKEETTSTVATANPVEVAAPVESGLFTTLNLSKNSTLNLSKTKKDNNISSIKVSCGWKGSSFGSNMDVDLSSLGYTSEGKVVAVTYYGNKTGLPGVKSLGDQLNGGEEFLEVSLDKIPDVITKVAFVINIYSASSRGQNLGKLKNAFVKVYLDGKEYAVFNTADYPSKGTGLVMGYLVKQEAGWMFETVGRALKIDGLGDINSNINQLNFI